jgi:GT2 family glycosyltransferase
MSAPIAVFAYRRPRHLRRMLESLLANPQAKESAIRIFCDGARGAEDRADVAATRAVARTLAPAHARVVERGENLGLARSVIGGVSELTAEFGSVIALEDDLVLSPYALDFLNRALERYRDEERVMHVSAYMFPVAVRLPEAFFHTEASCWGWATWARAWAHFEPDAVKLSEAVKARCALREFDSRGSYEFFRMLELQARGEIDSWAIRWYASIWLRGGLALHPDRALAANVGHDGSGVHSDVTDDYDVQLRDAPVRTFPDRVEPSEAAMRAMVRFRRRIAWRARWRGLWRRLAQRSRVPSAAR